MMQLLVPLMKYPKTGIKEIYGECLCVSERPYKIYPPCFRVLHEGDEYSAVMGDLEGEGSRMRRKKLPLPLGMPTATV